MVKVLGSSTPEATADRASWLKQVRYQLTENRADWFLYPDETFNARPCYRLDTLFQVDLHLLQIEKEMP